MARHDLRAEDCIVVADSERGLAAATAAWLSCLVVLSEWTRDADFSRAAKVLENIREVSGIVLKKTN